MWGPDPVPITASSGLVARSVLWQRGQDELLTLVAKAVLHFGADGAGRLAAAGELDDDDAVPFRPLADVTVNGRTPAPMKGRLSYGRAGRWLFQKTFSVGPQGMSGVDAAPRSTPSRAAMAGSHAGALAGNTLVVPKDLDPRYFQSAPEEQRVDGVLLGDTIHIEWANNAVRRMVFTVPNLWLRAQVTTGAATHAADMRADSARVDIERGTLSLTFRCQLRAPALGAPVAAVIGMSFNNSPFSWPTAPTPQPRPEIRPVGLPFQAAKDDRPSAPPSVPLEPNAPTGTVLQSADEIAQLRAQYAPQFASKLQHGKKSEAPPTPTAGTRTVTHSAEDVEKARAMFKSPFHASRAKTQVAPPPPATKAEPESPATPSGTAIHSGEDVAAVRAMFKTPFDRARALVKAPAPAPAPAPPAPAPPPAESPPPRVDEPEPAKAPEVHTAIASSEEVAALRARYATPFKRKGAKPTDDAQPAAPLPPFKSALESAGFKSPAATNRDDTSFGKRTANVQLASRPSTAVPFRKRSSYEPLVTEEVREGLGRIFLETLDRMMGA
ncbi:MAG: DUF2169 domain-containing protein [Polyangiaceae bacterium]